MTIMKKNLKSLIMFAFLFFNMQMFGQGSWVSNPWLDVLLTGQVHSLQWLEANSWWYDGDCISCGSGGPGGPGNPPPPPVNSIDLNILTYNLWRGSNHYATYINFEHTYVIEQSGANVVAIQEMFRKRNYNDLKDNTGLSGYYHIQDGNWLVGYYGIALLYNKSVVGSPISINGTDVNMHEDSHNDYTRAYISAEFNDFCIVCTHYPLNINDGNLITNRIIQDNTVLRCKKNNKPVYIAGDFNQSPGEPTSTGLAIIRYENAGYEVLNNRKKTNGKYEDATKEDGSMIDMILEYNVYQNKYHQWRGIPPAFLPSWLGYVSDHFPYQVKVKTK